MIYLLPNEIMVDILSYLSLKQLIEFTLVSKTNYQLIHSYPWQHLITIHKEETLEYLAEHYQFINFYPDYNNNFWKSTDNLKLDFIFEHNHIRNWLRLDESLFVKVFSKAKYLNLEGYDTHTKKHLTKISNLHILKGCTYLMDEVSHLGKIKVLSSLKVTEPTILNQNLFSLELAYGSVLPNLMYASTLRELKMDSYHLHIRDDYFYSMKNLEKLHLYGKGITGTCFPYLTNLQDLSMNYCNDLLQGQLGYLTNLTSLRIDHYNQSLDHDFAKLIKLQKLHIRECQITDDTFAYLTNLRKLNVRICPQITGRGFEYLTNLNTLELYRCGITNENFDHLSNLQHLECSSSNYSDSSLAYLTSLKTLALNYNGQIHGVFIPYLTQLYALNLSGCDQISDYALGQIGTLKTIEYLNLSHCHAVTNEGIISLSNCDQLSMLSLDGCNITDPGVRHLGKIKKLRKLSLNGCYITGKNFFALKNLHSLDLTNVPWITDRGMKYLTNLNTLILSPCHQITKSCMDKVFSKIKNLHINHIRGCECEYN